LIHTKIDVKSKTRRENNIETDSENLINRNEPDNDSADIIKEADDQNQDEEDDTDQEEYEDEIVMMQTYEENGNNIISIFKETGNCIKVTCKADGEEVIEATEVENEEDLLEEVNFFLKLLSLKVTSDYESMTKSQI
jgi:hypothetical protein